MCLGIPGRVVALVDGYGDQVALVDVEGAERRINIGMLDAAPRPGEWVLIHMGFALEVVSEEDAARALAGLEMLGRGSAGRVRRRLEVAGVVQGVGFRPFVYAAASELGLSGEVRNDSSGVVLEVEGDDAAVEELASRIRHHAPPLAVVEALTVTELAPVGGTGFRIADTTGVRQEGGPWPRPTSRCAPTAPPSCTTPRTAATATRSSAAPTAGRATRSSPGCPTTGRPPRWRRSRCAPPAGRSTTTPPTAGSTRRPSPAPTAARRCGCTGRDRPTATGDEALRATRALLADGAHRRDQGAGRLPPRLRRHGRDGGRGTAPPQAARRQAVRRDGSRPRRGPRRGRHLPGRGGGAHRRPPADPAGAAAGRHRGGGLGRAREPGPRGLPALHPGARAPAGRRPRPTRRPRRCS